MGVITACVASRLPSDRPRATGLTIEAGVAWNHSELVKEAAFLWADGTPINFGSLQTSSGEKVSNPSGAARQLPRRGTSLSGQHPRTL